jgi:hypothetical protein
MTQDKAREYFSAYHEGTLEPGLRSSLGRKLNGDVALSAEYDAFVATVTALDSLRSEVIETPSYLSDRIASRIDTARVAPAPFWTTWFARRPAQTSYVPRMVWATGLAACLIFAAVGLKGMGVGSASQAGVIDVPGSDSVAWTLDASGVTVRFGGSSARKVSVSPDGGSTEVFEVQEKQPLEVTLKNSNGNSRRFTIKSGSSIFGVVVVPGTRTNVRRLGSGSLEELATALSDTFHVPVVVKGEAEGKTFRWNLEGTDARSAAGDSLGGQTKATILDGNVLQIEP